MGGTHGSGFVSNANYVLEMSVVHEVEAYVECVCV